MDLSWFPCIIYGLISGITELLPVSSQAHEMLITKLFGMPDSVLLRLLVHAAVWEALYLNLRTQVGQMLQERELASIPPRYRSRQPDPHRILDLKLLKTALVPLALGFLAYPLLGSWRADLSKAAVFLLVNGLILYIPQHLRSGNKDSRSMTGFDGLLLGLCGALAAFPGISRIGTIVSAGVARGADKEHALNWGLLLNLAAMLFVIGLDAYALLMLDFTTITVPMLLCCVLAAAAAFGGAAVGIYIMRFLAFRAGFSGFAYYSWGAALFTFLIYLTT